MWEYLWIGIFASLVLAWLMRRRISKNQKVLKEQQAISEPAFHESVFHVIFLESRVLLTRKEYLNWKVIQDEYEDYKSSKEFEDEEAVIEFLRVQYKMSLNEAEEQVENFILGVADTVELNV